MAESTSGSPGHTISHSVGSSSGTRRTTGLRVPSGTWITRKNRRKETEEIQSLPQKRMKVYSGVDPREVVETETEKVADTSSIRNECTSATADKKETERVITPVEES